MCPGGASRTHCGRRALWYTSAARMPGAVSKPARRSWGARLGKAGADTAMQLTRGLFYPAHGESDGLVTPASARWGHWRGVLEGVSHQQRVDAFRRDGNGFDVCGFYIRLVQDLARLGF